MGGIVFLAILLLALGLGYPLAMSIAWWILNGKSGNVQKFKTFLNNL